MSELGWKIFYKKASLSGTVPSMTGTGFMWSATTAGRGRTWTSNPTKVALRDSICRQATLWGCSWTRRAGCWDSSTNARTRQERSRLSIGHRHRLMSITSVRHYIRWEIISSWWGMWRLIRWCMRWGDVGMGFLPVWMDGWLFMVDYGCKLIIF